MTLSASAPTFEKVQAALCAAIDVGAADDAGADAAPEWIHLLPAGEIRTVDGRGPYTVPSMHALAAQLKTGDKLPIDECHSTDLAARDGRPAPARGWIVALEARTDGPVAGQGLWGKVGWTGEGQRLMADKAYRGVSPVILHNKLNQVLGVLRASLINTPNLQGLTALHSEMKPGPALTSENTSMDWKAKLIERLGLDGGADDAAIDAALSAKMSASAAMHGAQDITTAPAFVALQGELAHVTQELNAVHDQMARDKATAFVDAAISEGRIGVKPARDEYVAMHMENPGRAEKLIKGMPILKGSSITETIAPEADPSGLDAGERTVMQLMGLSEDEYRESKSASGQRKEAL